jgi:hypothetical protein
MQGQYSFGSWSDGKPQSHNISAGPAPTVYVANINTQYEFTFTSSPAGSGSVTPQSRSSMRPSRWPQTLPPVRSLQSRRSRPLRCRTRRSARRTRSRSARRADLARSPTRQLAYPVGPPSPPVYFPGRLRTAGAGLIRVTARDLNGCSGSITEGFTIVAATLGLAIVTDTETITVTGTPSFPDMETSI